VTKLISIKGNEQEMDESDFGTAAIIVAHPDDETLWAGGTILMHPEWACTIVSLCRSSDFDRAPKFLWALLQLGAAGRIGDLDDGPEQDHLTRARVQEAVLSLLPKHSFDVLLTHSPYGEYSRHRRHEETGRAVADLWRDGRLSAAELWMFAYEDGAGGYLPRPIRTAHRITVIPGDVWELKRQIISEIYGFKPESFEARTTPREEAFWCFRSPSEFEEWIKLRGDGYESTCPL
jgi:LmbE family N-acetylglucosaminyl deacetylase